MLVSSDSVSSGSSISVVVGIDPGEKTGVCVLELASVSACRSRRLSDRIRFGASWLYEFPVDYSLGTGGSGGFLYAETLFCLDLCNKFQTLYTWPSVPLADDAVIHVAIEDFVLRERSMGRSLLSPVRITAGLCAMLSASGGSFLVTVQSASDAKTIVTDEVLRSLDLYAVGLEHGRDAARQAVLYLRKLEALRS